MGPDCGTAVVGGVGLGFANAVRAGPVGLVAASGTGAQQVMCLLDAAGVGVSHCLGVGGRDLSAAVRGRSTRAGARGPGRRPGHRADRAWCPSRRHPRSRPRSRRTPRRWARRCYSALLGPGRPDLTAATEAALSVGRRAGTAVAEPGRGTTPAGPVPGALRGPVRRRHALRRGDAGRRCGRSAPIRSNIPLRRSWALGADLRSRLGHVMHRLRRRRPDPGPGAPDDRPAQPAPRADRGRGRGPAPAACCCSTWSSGTAPTRDPAAELAPAITAAVATAPPTTAASCRWSCRCTGTEDDPQGLRAGRPRTLHVAGASVFLSNAQAARHALSLLAPASA